MNAAFVLILAVVCGSMANPLLLGGPNKAQGGPKVEIWEAEFELAQDKIMEEVKLGKI